MQRIWLLLLACAVSLLTIMLPTAARSKTIDIDMSVPPVVGGNASKADAVIGADTGNLLRLFRTLHEETRAGRVEARVAGTIASELVGRGFEVTFGADGTEVVATLRNGPGPVLLYRADTGSDLPALPQRPAAGITAGAEGPAPNGHRCGHDASVTWMLGMARALSVLRDEWAGTLVLVSQPTRLLGSALPASKTNGAEQRRVPKADMVLALRAAASPLGSILSLRGQRRAGSDTADVTMSRIGAYEAPRHAEGVAGVAESTTRLYGLPEDAYFGYLLIGIAPRELDGLDAAEIDATELDGARAGVDLAAIPLGTKLATVAVLELLDKAAHGRRPAAPGRGWTLHNY